MDEMKLPDQADALVLFGATGNLAYKQIFPALHALVQRGLLNIPMIGVASSPWTTQQLQDRVRSSIENAGNLDPQAFQKLASLLHYVAGDYTDPHTFVALRQALGAAKRPLY